VKCRGIAAARQINHDFVRPALVVKVSLKAGTQTPRLDPDDWIDTRVEAGLSIENVNSNHVLLEIAALAGERFRNDEFKEAAEPVDLLKRKAGQNLR
jgi:hypothetical protein